MSRFNFSIHYPRDLYQNNHLHKILPNHLASEVYLNCVYCQFYSAYIPYSKPSFAYQSDPTIDHYCGVSVPLINPEIYR